MNLVRALNFFLDFLVKQLKDGIFLFQDKYAKELVKKFMLDKTKNTHTPMRTSIFSPKILWEKMLTKLCIGVQLRVYII